MRFHVPALPWYETLRENSSCAYTQKVRRFCDMMTDLGNEVFLYAGENTDTKNAELVTVYSKEEANGVALWDPYSHPWSTVNSKVISEIQTRQKKGDIVALIAGICQKPIADVLDLMSVEYGIGYTGVFSEYKVFESYSWMHTVYGSMGDPYTKNGSFYDVVIPNYFTPDEFTFSHKKGNYLLYLGRLINRKGMDVISAIADKIDIPILVAGAGDEPPEGCDLLGEVGPEDRAGLLAGAKALLCPTIYIEPFGGVAVEAMLSGTPVISTDWGAFTETNVHGKTGFRCRVLSEFLEAINQVDELDPYYIQDYAIRNYSTDVVAQQYQAYFKQLLTLYGDGWNDRTAPVNLDRYKRFV